MKPTEKQKTIAEQEAERRHEAEIKELTKAHIEDIHALSRKFDEILDERLKAEREKATDAFCYLCFGRCPGVESCEKLNFFIEKLNANDPRVTV